MKFGGTSVADPDAIVRLIDIVRQQLTKGAPAPVVVVSALAGVTDRLVSIAQLAEEGAVERAAAELQSLLERHIRVAAAVTSVSRDGVLADVRHEFDELIGLVHALAVLREVSPRSRDAVLAVGEVVSSRIVAAALDDRDLPAEWVDARSVLVTDAEHTAAAPDMDATCVRAAERLAPVIRERRVAVLGGLIGAAPPRLTSTLRRRGSDSFAPVFAARLDVPQRHI